MTQSSERPHAKARVTKVARKSWIRMRAVADVHEQTAPHPWQRVQFWKGIHGVRRATPDWKSEAGQRRSGRVSWLAR